MIAHNSKETFRANSIECDNDLNLKQTETVKLKLSN